MMDWNGDWSGSAWFLMALSMAAFLALVALAVWLVVRTAGPNHSTAAPSDSAEALLRKRYAAGDIDDDEFTRRLHTLQMDNGAHR